MPTPPRIAVVDYGYGNLRSVAKALERCALHVVVTGDPAELRAADAVVLPGVGAFKDAAESLADRGLDGDRRAATATPDGGRHVTLVQAEHLEVVAALLGRPIAAEAVRRNLVVRGINLAALRERRFRIGDAVLEGTGHCHPCSRMEEVLGTGGYTAMRGHGGITTRVVEPGTIEVGATVAAI